MIGKVLRGHSVGGLLRYLYSESPAQQGELGGRSRHENPHLVGAWDETVWSLPELEPAVRAASRDFIPLTALLEAPLARAQVGREAEPVYHLILRNHADDRVLTDAEWGEIARDTLDRVGVAPAGDDGAGRWIAVRHADDHIHIVATLARQDGARIWPRNDYYRVREACLAAEERYGLSVRTADGNRTADPRASRAEQEKAVRVGRPEPARETLRRLVRTAAAGSESIEEFVARVGASGGVVHLRESQRNPGQVTGYAVGLHTDTDRTGRPILYSGGKLAADLSLPKLLARWGSDPSTSPHTVRAEDLRARVRAAADRASGVEEFFSLLSQDGMLVRRRESQQHPGQLTGYAVALDDGSGDPVFHGGGRLAADLTLPRLSACWGGQEPDAGGTAATGPAGATAPSEPVQPTRRQRGGRVSLSAEERRRVLEQAATAARDAVEQMRGNAGGDPRLDADTAWAAADYLASAARVVEGPAGGSLTRAAGMFTRAAREPYGRVPEPSTAGHGLRLAARAMTAAQRVARDDTRQVLQLLAQMAALADAITRLRETQQRAEQAAAAREAADLVRGDYYQRAAAAPAAAYSHAAAVPDEQAAAARAAGEPAGAGADATTRRPGRPRLPTLDPKAMPQPKRQPGQRRTD
ncbi:relaxase/mobilization nuclease-like protein [Motilibacter peucedani]|uniref:Relaxase/mobilization nuclease-like protein n=1 Tax=Motilibacter peucedani TaxID=598650 RepID=A0A420XUZ8_9ACTN|nr:relaxase/mobilization nuclease domain-containing protein [Motilibacter peucedani]RKS80665.1 relaxase/mobilization nuclease-like protein [Motilibacter peucedani]